MNDSLGQILSRTRIQKKLTLDQVYRAIKIKERYLIAIEEDRFGDLPSRVQGKGFIRLYWDYLKLPAETLESMLATSGWIPAVNNAESVPVNGSAIPEKISEELQTESRESDVDSTSDNDIAQNRSVVLFNEVGSVLRMQRQKLSLSLENIESITHIPSHYIHAMEEGRFDDLPSPVQGKGMLNNYAGFLDLDEDDLLLMYAEALQFRREEALNSTDNKKKKRSFRLPKPGGMRKQGIGPVSSFISLDIIVIVLLALVAFGSLIWGASAIVSYQMDPPATKTAQALIDALIQTATAGAGSTPSPTLEPTLTMTQGIFLVDEPPTGTIAPPVESGSPVSIFIVANQRAYLQVIVDGVSAFNGRVMPGTPYLFNGKAKVEVISGNAAALQVLFNQQDLGVLGEQGEVLHLIFSINAFGTPTLTPSITPSATKTPSKTLKPSNTYPPTRTKVPTSTPYPTRSRTPTRTPTP